MKIRVYDTYEQMSRAAADLITAQLLIKPNSRLGLTAGSTPIGMFAELVKLYREGSVFSESRLPEKRAALSCLMKHFDAGHELKAPDRMMNMLTILKMNVEYISGKQNPNTGKA